MKKNIFIISIIVIAVALIGSWLIDFGELGTAGLKEAGIYQEERQEGIKGQVTLGINDGENEIKISAAEFVEGMTAFNLLENAIKEKSAVLKTQKSSFGVMVLALEGKENGADGKYWMYYVNGELPQVSADKMALKPGDKVEFRFEKSSF
ncbi:MAG: DUF4430 domain-containing protein [Candidatus Staskawiczbacteria bacterium]|nr:DUF4430 domain-containing protein [Candidatus Staskawiczbacteria bacterium]